jgi:hypothetical protein
MPRVKIDLSACEHLPDRRYTWATSPPRNSCAGVVVSATIVEPMLCREFVVNQRSASRQGTK